MYENIGHIFILLAPHYALAGFILQYMIVPFLIAFGDEDGTAPYSLFSPSLKGGISPRAATKLGIGQPPLSQQIRIWKESWERSYSEVPHGAELTEAGKAFL